MSSVSALPSIWRRIRGRIDRTFLHYLRVLRATEIPLTQTSEAERDLLKKYLPGMKRIVEIGVFQGFTTRVLADHSDEDATIYGVDPFFVDLGVSWCLKVASKHNREHLRSGRLRLVRALSTEIGTRVPAEVDYVFVDADHSLEAIRRDWDFWSARLAPGGIIALHDTLLTPDRPKSAELGSHQYFRSHIQRDPRFEIVEQVDSLTVMRKEQPS
jgi:predicted O-methyltransferase YrrM